MVGVARQRRSERRKGTSSSPTEESQGPRKVYDVWYTPTVKDVYAQLKVAEQMLSRIVDPELAVVKREMYLLEDMVWQFIQG